MIKREETRYGTGEEVSGSAFLRRRQTIVVAVLLPALAWWSGPVAANPRGGSVVVGDVSIGPGAGAVLDIRQNSRNAIINWESFSIDAGEMTRFRQPGVNAAVLNRVTGGDPSAIHGALRANGNVFVINPNGILVGAGGTIDVYGLVLSTLDIENGEFLAGGDMVLKGAGAGVTNMGRINAIGGDVFLIGRTVSNSGSVSAPEGTVGLAAGEEVLLKAGAADERIFVRAAGAGVSGNGIFNDGTISGAAVEFKAHGNMYALAINNKGAIRATGATNSGGRVFLRGAGGTVQNSGSIRATSSGAGNAGRVLIEAAYAKVDGLIRAQGGEVRVAGGVRSEVEGRVDVSSSSGQGGSVVVEGDSISVGGGAMVDASGANGGSVRIGGGFQGRDADVRNALDASVAVGSVIRADGLETGTDEGRAGSVVIWSDGDTLFSGEISAQGTVRGGFVEVSGKERLGFDGVVSTLAADGTAGTLLLDPRNGIISTATHSVAGSPFIINRNTLQTALGSNHVVVSTFDTGATEEGHLSVRDSVIWNSNFGLTLLAEGDIYVGAHIVSRGAGDINLVAGWDPGVAPLGMTDGSAYNPGSLIDMAADLFGVPGSFGHNEGSVYVGSRDAPDTSADIGVMVGSRLGATNVAGHNVNVWAGPLDTINNNPRKFAQIGYERVVAGTGTNSISGEIRVEAVNDVSVVSNRYAVGADGYPGWANSPTTGAGSLGYNAYAQIGHGGREALRQSNMSGAIRVVAGRDIVAEGGKTRENYVMIGHGGYDNKQTDATAVIGPAEITVLAERDIILHAGSGNVAFAQIGHGGVSHDLASFAESAITVEAGRHLTLLGGSGSPAATSTISYAQIGHGGYDSDMDGPGPDSYRGDITVTAGGGLSLAGGDRGFNYALIGNGGAFSDGGHSGEIAVTAGTGVEVVAGNGATPVFAQIGHNSYSSTNTISGTVSVTSADGGILLQGGNSTANYATIGSGGYLIGNGSTIAGDTFVTSLGTDATDGVTLRSGDGFYASAHIGHLAQLGGPGPLSTLSGDINVEVAGGGLLMEASALGYFSHVMIGHGGRDISGIKSGNVSVNVAAGDISVLAGGLNASSRYNHAQIGHGGYGNGISGSDITGTGVDQGIRLVAEDGNIVIRGGRNAYSYAMVGNGGVRAGTVGTFNQFGDISVKASGDIIAAGGTTSYTHAQIGHGGPSAVANYIWNLGGAIEVEAGGSVTASGGNGAVSNSQIGHGGLATTTTSSIAASPVSVKAITGDVHLLSGTVSSSGAKIGHGNYNQKLATFGESPVTVEAGRNVRLISPQFSTYTGVSNSGTQIGHGGFGATVGPLPSTLGYSGDINVTAGGKLDVIAGKNAASYNWSLLGHTSYFNSTGIHSGDITVTAGTQAGLADYGVTVQGAYGDYIPLAGTNSTSGGYYSFASIGHRGHSNGVTVYYTGLNGDILVDAVRGGVSVLGGDGVDGSTLATTPPDIRLHGAQIGHGGFAAGHLTEGIHGSVRVHAQEDILLRSGTSRNAAVMIGHGGYSSFGPMGKVGEVLEVVSRSGSLELDSTLAINSVRGGVMIGHGAPTPGAGTRMGDVLVDVAGEISMVGNLSYIGHRSSTASAISNADVTIRAAALDFTSGVSGGGLFQVGGTLGATLTTSLAAGNVSLVATGSGGIWLSQDIRQNSAFALNLLSQGNLYLTAHALNQGSGAVNLVAGWDPSVSSLSGGASTVPGAGGLPRQYWIRGIDMDAEIFGAAGSFGVGGGSVWVGASPALAGADRAVMAASRTGETNVAGSSVHVWGGAVTGGIDAGERRYSQIGYNRREAGTAATQGATGRIRVVAENDVEVVANKYAVGALGNGAWSGGNRTGFVSYAQIGHGGDREAIAKRSRTWSSPGRSSSRRDVTLWAWAGERGRTTPWSATEATTTLPPPPPGSAETSSSRSGTTSL